MPTCTPLIRIDHGYGTPCIIYFNTIKCIIILYLMCGIWFICSGDSRQFYYHRYFWISDTNTRSMLTAVIETTSILKLVHTESTQWRRRGILKNTNIPIFTFYLQKLIDSYLLSNHVCLLKYFTTKNWRKKGWLSHRLLKFTSGYWFRYIQRMPSLLNFFWKNIKPCDFFFKGNIPFCDLLIFKW